MSCRYSGDDLAIKQTCQCQGQIDSLSKSIKVYEDTLTSNANANSKYNTDLNNYNINHDRWSSNRQNKLNDLLGEQKESGCGGCGTEQVCPGGWHDVERFGCGWSNLGCNHHCKRNTDTDTANSDLGGWLSQNS